MSNGKQVYLYMGDDDYPMGVAARELVNTLIPPAEQAFGLEIIEGRADSEDEIVATIKRCREALVTPGFLMARGKVIWWRAVTFLADPRFAAFDSVKAGMKDLAAILDEGHAGDATLVITAAGMDKRSAFYKLAASKFEVREFLLPEKAYLLEQHGRGILARELKGKGITMDADTQELMRLRIGADARQIAMEVDKLDIFLGGRKQATEKDVKAVISPTGTAVMWDLMDAVGNRKLPEALSIVRDLFANRENARGIMASLSTRLRDLLLYREALDKGWLRMKGNGAEWGGVPETLDSVLSTCFKRDPRTLPPYVAGKMAQQARCHSTASLRANQRLLVETHEKLVTSRVAEQTILELMFIRMLTQPGVDSGAVSAMV